MPIVRKKFNLGIRDLRTKLAKSEQKAKEAVAAGRKAVAGAKKQKDKKLIKRHQDELNGAIRARDNLAKSVRLMEVTCRDQFLNCDPEFP